jgi:uncharacterized protein YecE (DUF72 family)
MQDKIIITVAFFFLFSRIEQSDKQISEMSLAYHIMAKVSIGCSGWNYGDPVEKGGWVGSFYPDPQTKRLRYYSEFFPSAELDATFYQKFYSKMTSGTFYGMVKATPPGFQFSVKAPETVTHTKLMDVSKGALEALQEFLEKISPLKNANKLGAILLQLPPSSSKSKDSSIRCHQAMIMRWSSAMRHGRLRDPGKC